MEHPEEIYKDINGKEMSASERHWGEGMNRRRAYRLGYEAGKAEQADPLEGYSNLTEAIKSKQPIDWERLDGLNVKCVKPEPRGEIHGTLKRRSGYLPDVCGAWWDVGMGYAYVNALVDAWYGNKGWTLYVEGEIPLRRKTADELEVGTYFSGKVGTGKAYLLYVGEPMTYGAGKAIYYAPEMKRSYSPASEWVVLEEYGPFQAPEGK